MIKLGESTITSRWQVVIPKKVLQKLRLKPGDKVVFRENEKGPVLTPKRSRP